MTIETDTNDRIPSVTELYNAYRGFVLALLNKSLTEESDIQDVSQEVWLAIHKYHFSLHESVTYTNWIAQVVRSRIIDFVRKNKLRNHANIEEYQLIEIKEPVDRDTIIALREAVRCLPDKERDAIYRVYYQGEQVLQVARDLHMTRRAIAYRRDAALRKLRELLAG